MTTDAWVFVDGQVRAKLRQINAYSGAVPMNIPLHARDRFLTFAATDGGSTIDHDWIIFGDPRLELGESPNTETTLPSTAK